MAVVMIARDSKEEGGKSGGSHILTYKGVKRGGCVMRLMCPSLARQSRMGRLNEF